jgi:hypothetical protein
MNDFDFSMPEFARYIVTGKGLKNANDDSAPIYKKPSNYSVFNGEPADELEFSGLDKGMSIVFNLEGGICVKAMRLEVAEGEFEYWLAFADCHVTPESGDVGTNIFLKKFDSAFKLVNQIFDSFYWMCVCEFSEGKSIALYELALKNKSNKPYVDGGTE